jgi:Glycosyltransferase family 87
MTQYTFLPYLVLVVAPLAWVVTRMGPLMSAPLRWVMRFALAALAIGALPLGGLDYEGLKKLNLLLSGTMVVVLLLRNSGVPWWSYRENYRRFLGGMAVASTVAYVNFFSFHGGHAFMHLHDVAHYYLGSKYFHELGYGNLYTAMARAEAEEYSGVLWPREVRDLSSNALVPVEAVLRSSEPIKRRFRAERWSAFRADVRYFRDAMGARYADVLVDHGYNPTPVWTLVGGTIANLVPAGSASGIFLLTLLDPILEVAAFAAIGWAFGLETMLESLIYFCILFGAMFTWVGGAYLRYVSFAAIIGAACCLRRQRSLTAGALLALAATLRVFPAFFVAGPFLQGVGSFLRTRQVPRSSLRFVGAFVLTALALFLATCWIGDGYAQWEDFRSNTSSHMGSVSANILGFTNLPTFLLGVDVTRPAGLEAFLRWRSAVFTVQLAVIFPLALGVVAILSQRSDEVHAMALGALLVLTGVNVSAYYYTFMVLLVLAYRGRAAALALLFAAEFLVYTFQLFDDHEVLMHLYKSALLFGVFAALFGPELWTAVGERVRVGRSQSATPVTPPPGRIS